MTLKVLKQAEAEILEAFLESEDEEERAGKIKTICSINSKNTKRTRKKARRRKSIGEFEPQELMQVVFVKTATLIWMH